MKGWELDVKARLILCAGISEAITFRLYDLPMWLGHPYNMVAGFKDWKVLREPGEAVQVFDEHTP